MLRLRQVLSCCSLLPQDLSLLSLFSSLGFFTVTLMEIPRVALKTNIGSASNFHFSKYFKKVYKRIFPPNVSKIW